MATHRSRCSRLVLSGLTAVALACAPPAANKPNVLLIVLDTTRADVLSSYGNPRPTSPEIDRIAAEGVSFENAHTTTFWTLPSHASLLTGLYPSDHGATSETRRLPPGVTTLPQRLAQAGYRTGAFITNPWIGRDRGFSAGFATFVEAWRTKETPGVRRRHEDKAVQAGIEWIREAAASDQPFFVFFNLNTAHLPYSPDPLKLAEIAPQPRPMDRVVRLKKMANPMAHMAGRLPLDALDFEILRDLYEAEILMLDEQVGRLVEALRELDLLDETIVVITSDHGENLGDHGKIDHVHSMHQTVIRVPLILRYPPRLPRGARDSSLASLVDVPATVLDLCGFGPDAWPEGGRSLAGTPTAAPEFVVAENDRPITGIELMSRIYPDFDTSEIDQKIRMIRTRRYKLIWRENQASELYDLMNDPDEERNVAQREPEVVARLLLLLGPWIASAKEAGVSAEPFRSSDEESNRQLRALGYAE